MHAIRVPIGSAFDAPIVLNHTDASPSTWLMFLPPAIPAIASDPDWYRSSFPLARQSDLAIDAIVNVAHRDLERLWRSHGL